MTDPASEIPDPIRDLHVITPVGPAVPPDHLADCLRSVAAQTGLPDGATLTHHLVLDGPPAPALLDFLDSLDLSDLPSLLVTPLPANAGDIGSTPRTVGAALAWGLGAHAVAFLDADCSYLPDHLSRLLAYQARLGKPIVASGRTITNHDGTLQAPCREMVMGHPFWDTNTYLFTRGAIGLTYTFGGLSTRREHEVGDRILSQRVAPYLACHYHPTVLYRSAHRCHYAWYDWPVPDGLELKDLSDTDAARASA